MRIPGWPRSATRLLTSVGLLLALSGCGPAATSPTGSPPTATGPVSSASLAPGTPEPTSVPRVTPAPGSRGPIPADSITVDLGGETNGVTACNGPVWVATLDAVVQIDPASGAIKGKVDGGTNSACVDGEVWVAIGGVEIRHVDSKTRATLASAAVESFYVGGGAGSVWAGSHKNVVRMDPETAQVVATIPIETAFDITEVEGNGAGIWVTVKEANRVFRIDPATNTVVAEVEAGAFAHGILVQAAAIWISNAHEETITRIDPVANVAALFVVGPGSGVGLAEGGGYVWASSRDAGDLYRIDPETSVPVAVARVGGWPYGIASTDTMLWVSDGLHSVYGIPLAELLPH